MLAKERQISCKIDRVSFTWSQRMFFDAFPPPRALLFNSAKQGWVLMGSY